MTITKNRIVHFLIIISTIILIDFIYFEIAKPANNTGIIIDKNLKPGMTLKNAIELLGPPESIKVSNIGTVVIPYNTLGLSIEVMSDGTIIEAVHLHSSFKGKFASGLEIGADYQEILSVYNQPDLMTKEFIEYYDTARIFRIREGRLVAADLYSGKNRLYRQVSIKETGKYEEVRDVEVRDVEVRDVEVRDEEARDEEARDEEARDIEARDVKVRDEEVREKVREEVREEILEEVRDEAREEVREELRVFDLFGFKVRKTPYKGVIITEIRPDSVAEHGGLQVGKRIRKASLKDYGVRNIYYVRGLEAILEKAIKEGKKTVNILQDENYYYKVEVPKTK
jgi:hypothetical protein